MTSSSSCDKKGVAMTLGNVCRRNLGTGHSFPKAMMTEPRPGEEADAQMMFVWG